MVFPSKILSNNFAETTVVIIDEIQPKLHVRMRVSIGKLGTNTGKWVDERLSADYGKSNEIS